MFSLGDAILNNGRRFYYEDFSAPIPDLFLLPFFPVQAQEEEEAPEATWIHSLTGPPLEAFAKYLVLPAIEYIHWRRSRTMRMMDM